MPKNHFIQGWAGQKTNGTELTEAEDIKKRWHQYIGELYKKKKKERKKTE